MATIRPHTVLTFRSLAHACSARWRLRAQLPELFVIQDRLLLRVFGVDDGSRDQVEQLAGHYRADVDVRGGEMIP